MDYAVIILNWNGADDTIACLSSLSPHLAENDYVFIVDNGSADASVHKIDEYLKGEKKDPISANSSDLTSAFRKDRRFYICKNGANLGFGAGNNMILRMLPEINPDFWAAWLLNNDAVVYDNTFISLKRSLQKEPKIAVVGSLIVNFPDAETIQCTGVKHFKTLGVSKLINKNKPLKQLGKVSQTGFDYLNGASLMFKMKPLTEVGYFDEGFFLYSEEFDLQLRLVEKGYSLFLDLESIVAHKLSGATSRNKHLFYYYYNFSAVKLNRKHFSPVFTATSILGLSAITLVRTFPSVRNFVWGLKGILKGLKGA